MPDLGDGISVDVEFPQAGTGVDVETPDWWPASQTSATVVPVRGQAADESVALTNHIQNERPHQAAESGRDFAGWYTAGVTP